MNNDFICIIIVYCVGIYQQLFEFFFRINLKILTNLYYVIITLDKNKILDIHLLDFYCIQ